MLITDFFKDVYTRFSSKSPLFFRIIQVISGIATLITGLPAIFEQVGIKFDTFPSPYRNTVMVASIVGLVISQLTMSTNSPKREDLKLK